MRDRAEDRYESEVDNARVAAFDRQTGLIGHLEICEFTSDEDQCCDFCEKTPTGSTLYTATDYWGECLGYWCEQCAVEKEGE